MLVALAGLGTATVLFLLGVELFRNWKVKSR
jgi:hypothetical protein